MIGINPARDRSVTSAQLARHDDAWWHGYTGVCVQPYMCACVCVYIYIYIHTPTHMCAHTHTYTHTHTHTHIHVARWVRFGLGIKFQMLGKPINLIKEIYITKCLYIWPSMWVSVKYLSGTGQKLKRVLILCPRIGDGQARKYFYVEFLERIPPTKKVMGLFMDVPWQ